MIIKNIILVFVLITSLIGTPSKVIAEPIEIKTDWSKAEIVTLIDETAEVYKVSAIVMKKVVQCESQYNTNAVNKTSKEYSIGLVQINRMAHPNITVEQAKNPEFALNFLAKNLKRGNGNMWSCYRYT